MSCEISDGRCQGACLKFCHISHKKWKWNKEDPQTTPPFQHKKYFKKKAFMSTSLEARKKQGCALHMQI